MTKQAAIYARVSTDDQAERGYSIPSQKDACKKFADEKGWNIAGVYLDDISGTVPVSDRPEGSNLQKAIETKLIRAVIVYQVDRLSRDIVDLLTTVRDWLRAGVEIYSLDVGQITSELDIVLVIKGWQGSDERQKIRERTMRGKSAKAKAGKVVGEGVAPFGYSYQDGGFVIHEQQAEVIRMIFNWYVNGDKNGQMMGFVAIAERLTKMGIASPLNAKGILRYHGRVIGWGSNTIRRIIISETYCGTWQWGKRTRAKEDQIPVTVPAIISRELWDLAQERRVHNSKFSKRRMKREYLLRGLVYCGCGHSMVGSGREKYYYYYCSRKYGSGVSVGSDVCSEPIIRGQKLEYIAWSYVIRLLTNADEFEQKLREAQQLEAEQRQPKQKELEIVLSLMEQTEREAEEAAVALSQVRGIVGKKLQIQADEIDRRYQALLVRKEKLEVDLEVELSNETVEEVMIFREAVAVGLNDPTPEEQRLWLELLQTRVTVSNGEAVVTCRLNREGANFDVSTGYRISANAARNRNAELIFTSEPFRLADVLFSEAGKVEILT